MSSNNPKLRNLLERIKQKILKIEGFIANLIVPNNNYTILEEFFR